MHSSVYLMVQSLPEYEHLLTFYIRVMGRQGIDSKEATNERDSGSRVTS